MLGDEFILKKLSVVTGADVEGLRLVLSILSGYLIAVFHRNFLYGKPPGIQHLYFIIMGLFLGFYNFGLDVLHTTVTLLFVYAILKTIGGTLHSVIITIIFTMVYLLVGYAKNETESYDIVWTMPHCILVLRLSGLAFDIYDGSFPEKELSKDSKKVALLEVPSLLEMAAYAYFPTSFLVGPQFPMKRYQDFVAGKLKHNPQSTLPECVWPGLKTLAVGLLYIGIFCVGSNYYPDSFILGPEFAELSFFRRICVLGIWGHITLIKYIAIWLLSEGSCTLIGLTYNGTDKDENPKWDACSNANVVRFECAQTFTYDYIGSFNINTNQWMLHYVYKRLRFLGNKYYSQIGVLVFLSIWHGFHSGYYLTFLMEFLGVALEKDLEVILTRNKVFLDFLSLPVVKQIKWIVLKFYTIVVMGPCIAPLALRSFNRWWPIYCNTYFFVVILWGPWLLYRPIVKALLPPHEDFKKKNH